MKFILATLLFALPFWVIAQQNNYTGTIVDENGKALINYTDGKPINEEAARYVRGAFDKSLIQDFKVLAYLQSVKFSSKIPKDVINKVGKALTKNSDKILLDNFNDIK